jgi:hypothetical protein
MIETISLEYQSKYRFKINIKKLTLTVASFDNCVVKRFLKCVYKHEINANLSPLSFECLCAARMTNSITINNGRRIIDITMAHIGVGEGSVNMYIMHIIVQRVNTTKNNPTMV